MIDSRKYIQLIQKVGSHHKYQIVICLIMIALNIIETAAIFMMPYLLHQSSYKCQSLSLSQCNKFVCSLDQPMRKHYQSSSSFFSLADQLGNFRCQNNQELDTLQSLIFVGAITGMCFFSIFTERLGRKKSLLSSMVIFFIGIMIIFFSKNTLCLGLGVFVCFAGCETAIQYTSCYSSEVVSQKYRFKFSCTIALTDSLGIMLNSIAFKYINNWKHVFILLYIIPIIAMIVAMLYFIEETPIDLLSNQTSQQIAKVLQKIADFNQISHPDIDVQKIEILRLEYHSQSKNQPFNPLDLCRFSSLKPIVISLIIANFFSNYLFYAPSFIQKNMSQDLFMNNIIAGISKMVSAIFVYYSLTRLQRKKAMLFLNVGIVIFSIMMFLNVFKTNSIPRSIVYFLFRLKVSVLESLTFVLNYETFPTQIRATAALICYLAAQMAGIIQPWMNKSAEHLKLTNFYIFAIFGLLNCVNTMFIRETFGVAPPQIIQQLHHEDVKDLDTVKKQQSYK